MNEDGGVHKPSERACATFNEVRALLGIDDGWHLWLREADKPGDYDNADGHCALEARYLKATITIRRGLDAEREREVILHELFHVALAPIDLANDRIIELLPEGLRDHGETLFGDAEEQVIERLTRAMTLVKYKYPEPSSDAESETL